jgi:hypothetical protein
MDPERKMLRSIDECVSNPGISLYVLFVLSQLENFADLTIQGVFLSIQLGCGQYFKAREY